MKLQIDNLDGDGLRDYTPSLDASKLPRVVRKLNQPSEMRASLVAENPEFVVPVAGGRVLLTRSNGQGVFTGYLTAAPAFEYLGWGERGPVYRYNLMAQSDEAILDRKRLPYRSPFVARSAGGALRQLAADLLPGAFDVSVVEDVDTLASYRPNTQQKWSEQAAEIALQARAAYRAIGGALKFAAVGEVAYGLSEGAANFTPGGLKLTRAGTPVNDVIVTGQAEPQAYVTDYFVGDGLSLRFYLSQPPFSGRNRTQLDEEYVGTVLSPVRWTVTDPAGVVSVAGGKLQVNGGTGLDGQTKVVFSDQIELGGAFVLQHGDVSFDAASDGVLGGLYTGTINVSSCLAGFRATPQSGGTNLQALVNGAPAGAVLNTVSSHRYVLTTRFYSSEIYRSQQIFHSSVHPAGAGRGGAAVLANVRLVLEVHEIDPANPGSLVAPSVVLYDGVVSGAPGYCTYALVNSASIHCGIAFTRLIQSVDTEVRSAQPGQSYRTRLVGALSEGAECTVASNATLAFFSQSVPAPNELIVVRYRGLGRALARVTDPASIAGLQQGDDDGVRGAVLHVKLPPARTAADCETAALALLDDVTEAGWSGEYETWSDFLPGAATDVFPGDGLNVDVASRGAIFGAVVREVEIAVRELAGEHSQYRIVFANDAAAPLGFEFDTAQVSSVLDLLARQKEQVGNMFLPPLTSAVITQVTSTNVTVDAGTVPPSGGGIEVRWSDVGWGQANDRNLAMRATTQSFTLPRLSRIQNYFLRQFDGSIPPKYSRYSAALHLDYPL